MKYKFIHFEEEQSARKKETKIDFYCYNNKSGDLLGFVFWYAPWKQYCFTQSESQVVFNHSCLTDIADFLKKKTEERKK